VVRDRCNRCIKSMLTNRFICGGKNRFGMYRLGPSVRLMSNDDIYTFYRGGGVTWRIQHQLPILQDQVDELSEQEIEYCEEDGQ
jgi:hypothetical protein